MKFSKEYFEGEYREDFFVEPMMKKYWASQLEVLSKITSICDKYGIKYFALWGSLLGAIRHKGFVPWDDDIDIAMLRDDYERFFEVAASELPRKYRVLTIYSEPKWDVGIGRVTNDGGIIVDKERLEEYHGCPYSVGIDIFPYDYLPDDRESIEYLSNITNLITTVKTSVIGIEAENEEGIVGQLEETICQGLDYLENMFGFQFNRSFHLINQLDCLYDQVYSSMGNTNSRFVTCYMEKNKRKNDFKIPTYWLREKISVEFENTKINVPKYHEAVLSICYGNNFMIPIKSGVAGHDYPIYKIQTKFMEDRGLDKVYEQMMNFVTEDYSDEEYIAPINSFLNIIDEADTSDGEASEKKSVLYCIGSIDTYTNEHLLLEKVRNTLDFFNTNNSVKMTLSIDPLVYDMLEWKDKRYSESLRNLVNEFKSSSNSSYIEYSDIPKYVRTYDAYYGSSCKYIKYFQLQGKPIMIHNLNIINK